MDVNFEKDPSKITSQWITSLAVSVVACAFLFLVFAIYIADLRKLNEQMNLTVIRLEALQMRQMQLIADLESIRRGNALVLRPSNLGQPAPQTTALPAATPSPPENASQAPTATQESMPPVVIPAIRQTEKNPTTTVNMPAPPSPKAIPDNAPQPQPKP